MKNYPFFPFFISKRLLKLLLSVRTDGDELTTPLCTFHCWIKNIRLLMLFSPWAGVISCGREGLPARGSAWLPVRWPECIAPHSHNKLDSAVKSSAFASPSNAPEPRRPLLWFMVSRTSSRNLACLSRSVARVDSPPSPPPPTPPVPLTPTRRKSHFHESSTPKRKKKAGLQL